MIHLHTICLKQLRKAKRIVISQPEDEIWPKNFEIPIYFCDGCHKIAPFEEIKEVVRKRKSRTITDKI